MRFSAGNAQSIGARSEQQDSFGFSDPLNSSFVAHAGVLAVIADGMGGLAHGSAASQTAVRAFLEAYHSKDLAEEIPDALWRAIQSANQAVVNVSHEADAVNGLGTTLAAAVMHRDSLYWISAGDSRVYLYRDGTLTCLTADHIYAADLENQVSKGEITQMLASNHPERASLTSYLGLEKLPKIEHSRRPFPVQPGDCALICSDGLYRALSDEEIAASLQKDAAKTCETLVQRAIEKGNPAQDNITVLVLRCSADAAPLAVAARKPRLGVLLLAGIIGFLTVVAAFLILRFHPFKPDAAHASQPAPPQNGVAAVSPSGTPGSTGSSIRRVGSSPLPTTAAAASSLADFTWNFKGATSVSVQGVGVSRKPFPGPQGTLRYDPHQATTYSLKPVFAGSHSINTEFKITLSPDTPSGSKTVAAISPAKTGR